MATIKEAIRTYLLSQTAVTDLTTRIRTSQGHGATKPYIVFRRLSSQRSPIQDGASGQVVERFQFDCYGTDENNAEALKEALRTVLDGQGLVTWSGVAVHNVMLDNDLDDFNPPQHGQQEADPVCSVDFLFDFDEAVS